MKSNVGLQKTRIKWPTLKMKEHETCLSDSEVYDSDLRIETPPVS
jgi:hypothetical protein